MVKLKRSNLDIWKVLSFIIVVMVILPNTEIIIKLFKEPNENWMHIKENLLKIYTLNSLRLVTITGVLTGGIGLVLSWLISMYDFPFRNFFRWGLILPLAIPPYIAAYTYNGMLSYTGFIQTNLRNYSMNIDPRMFNIMSMKGAIFIFTLFLFPYVYIITKSFLEKQSAALIESGRVLGRSSLEIFWLVVLPMTRGALIGGVSLVALEVLNDYGVVNYFGVQTFSTAIFKAWFGMSDIDSAIKLSGALISVVLSLLVLEKFLRGKKRYSFTTTQIRPIVRIKLRGIKAVMASLFCFSIFSLGFLIPTIQLISWGALTYKKVLNMEFINFMFSSFMVSLIAGVLIIVFALILVNYCRLNNKIVSKIYSKIAILGYSIPGAVIAIGVITMFITLDRKFSGLYTAMNLKSSGLVLSTSIVVLIFAYIIRFIGIAYNSIEAGFEKIGNKFSEASRTLGYGITKTFLKVDLPMIRGAVWSGFFLVFIEILKELPLTLILRPFNFNTLATKAYEYANDEMIHEASIPSLLIIFVSLVSIYIFYNIGEKVKE